MGFLPVHPDMTEAVQVPDDGPTFTLGFWPPREAERLGFLVTRARKAQKELDPVADYADVVKETGLAFETFRDMARFSVRDWSGFGDMACSTELVEIDGRKHKVLTAEAVEILSVNRLLVAVGSKAMAFNMLTEDQKKTSAVGWKSNSSIRPIAAQSVTPDSTPLPNP